MNYKYEYYPYNLIDKCFAQTFYEYMKDYKRFSENFRLLLDNLSESQQEFLISIFSRILYVYNGQCFSNADFTPEEIAGQKDIHDNFRSKIIKEGDIFRYKDYILPSNSYEASIFFYEMGFKNIKNKDKLAGMDFIDAGAYIGDSAVMLNKLNPGKIYAFEGISRVY